MVHQLLLKWSFVFKDVYHMEKQTILKDKNPVLISLQALLNAMNSSGVLLKKNGGMGNLHVTFLNVMIKKEVILSIVFLQLITKVNCTVESNPIWEKVIAANFR